LSRIPARLHAILGDGIRMPLALASGGVVTAAAAVVLVRSRTFD